MEKDKGWKKRKTDFIQVSPNKWISLSKHKRNHSPWDKTVKTKINTSNNWIVRGTKIDPSWSTNEKEKDNHSYDFNEYKIKSPYNNRSCHQNDRYCRHYNNYNTYQPQCSNKISYQQNRLNSNIEIKVKTSHINKNSNDKLYNVTHNYIERKEPNTTCYIWSDKRQTRNYLQMTIGNE